MSAWMKSSYSAESANCVEVRFQEDGAVVVRHSRDRDMETFLHFSSGEWAAFVAGVKDGEFDPRG